MKAFLNILPSVKIILYQDRQTEEQKYPFYYKSNRNATDLSYSNKQSHGERDVKPISDLRHPGN